MALLFAGTLLASPVVATAQASTFLSLTNQSIVAADLVQTNRLDAGTATVGTPPVCGAMPSSAATTDGAAYHFDRYALVNQTDQWQCITVTVTPSSCAASAIQSATYVPGFNPASVAASLAGESASPVSGPYEVLVGAGQPFVVTVNETSPGGFCGGYGLTLTSSLPWAITPPTVTGPAVTGETLSATSNWGTTPAPTITRQWRRCDADGAACSDIPGAVEGTYVPTDADVGATLRLFETATDPSGTSTSMGPPTTPVQSGRPRPAYTRTSGSTTLEHGTALVPGSQGDDVVVDFPLPFPVSFFGTEYTSARLGVNGVLQFQSANPTPLNAGLPTTRLGPAIAAHWDDLVTTGVGEGIFTSVTGTEPNRVLHIEWRASLFPGGADTVNFEIRLPEGSPSFSLVYGSVAKFGSTATVGIQAASIAPLTDQFSFNTNSLPGGLHLQYSSSRPSVAGTAREGVELSGADASWVGPGPISQALQWLACDAAGAECSPIPGAEGASFTPSAGQVGRRLRLRSTATNARGATTLVSAATDLVAATGSSADRTQPVIRSLKLSNATFRVARGVTPITAAAKRGTNIRSDVSEPGKARYTIQRELLGRLDGKRCRKPTRKLRKRKSCRRYREVSTLHRSVKAGANTFFFSGRIRSLALAPARYRVVMRVTDAAGNVSINRSARFRIVSR